MMELSLHIMDIVENSTRAGADIVAVSIEIKAVTDRLTINILDNGSGMDEEMIQIALDPFMTTKENKKTGLGLSLMREAARKTGGDLTVNSSPGLGTAVEVDFGLTHVDRQPLGDLVETFICLLMSHPQVEFQFVYIRDDNEFSWDSTEITAEFGACLRSAPLVMNFIRKKLGDINKI